MWKVEIVRKFDTQRGEWGMPGAKMRERKNTRQHELTGRGRYTNSVHLYNILELAKSTFMPGYLNRC